MKYEYNRSSDKNKEGTPLPQMETNEKKTSNIRTIMWYYENIHGFKKEV